MITILDGGLGLELARRGTGSHTGLWSAKALLEAPDSVVEVHKDYITAGARIITTNSYSTIPSYLGTSDLAARYVELTQLAGELARRAVQESGEKVLIAGSLPPLSVSYRPDLVPDATESTPVYEAMVLALRDHVDMFLCETMSTGEEALNAVKQASQHGGGKPIMVSWTLNEEAGKGLRNGESIADAFGMLKDYDIESFLFNCTSPEAILAAIKEMRNLTDKPIGGYPNRFTIVDPNWTLDNGTPVGGRPDIDIDYYVSMAHKFEEAGASIIGGCCGVGPEFISALSESVNQASA
ncbi:MAG: homocysteine S-methyltransferase family protein [Pseudomonadota bacterium]